MHYDGRADCTQKRNVVATHSCYVLVLVACSLWVAIKSTTLDQQGFRFNVGLSGILADPAS